MNLNDTSFLNLKIQQSPAPKESINKSFQVFPQQQSQGQTQQAFGGPDGLQKPQQVQQIQQIQQQQSDQKSQVCLRFFKYF